MVRIVDPNPDRSVVKQIVCRSCGVRLEYVPRDVKVYHGKDYSGGPDGRKWIDCANCGAEVVTERW